MFNHNSKKLDKLLADNPDYQFAFILGLIDELIKGLDKVTEDVIEKNKDLVKYRDQLDRLQDTTIRNLVKVSSKVGDDIYV